MKICIIAALYEKDIIGGAEIYVERIVKKLSENNDIVIITTDKYSRLRSLRPSKEIKERVTIYRFYPANIYHVSNAAKKPIWIKPIYHLIDIWNPYVYFLVKNILFKEKPDLVHTHNLEGLSTSAISAIDSLRIPHIHTVHDYILLNRWNNMLRGGKIIKKFNFFDRYYMKVMRRISRPIHIILAPSKFILDIHIKNGYFCDSTCKKLSLGIELENISKNHKEYDIIRILYVGQISEHKGVHILIKAFEMLKNDNIRLHIVGKNREDNYIKNLVEISKDDERVIFHGFVHEEFLKELYQKSNIVVIPSIWYDNSPLVIYESFKSGTPVIGSNIGGISELIRTDYNGYLFDAGNAEELTNIINDLINNISSLQKLEKGAMLSAKKYDINEHITKLLDVYKSVVRK